MNNYDCMFDIKGFCDAKISLNELRDISFKDMNPFDYNHGTDFVER